MPQSYDPAFFARRRARLLAEGSTAPSELGRRRERTVYKGKPCIHGHDGWRYSTGHCVECHRQHSKASAAKSRADPANAEKLRDQQARASAHWYAKNKDRVLANTKRNQARWRRERPGYRAKESLKTYIRQAIKGAGGKKTLRTLQLLGLRSFAEYRRYLEARFTPEMTWENYGAYWEIDHIVPLCAFDLTDPKQQRRAFHHANTRPLSAPENRKKSGKLLR